MAGATAPPISSALRVTVVSPMVYSATSGTPVFSRSNSQAMASPSKIVTNIQAKAMNQPT